MFSRVSNFFTPSVVTDAAWQVARAPSRGLASASSVTPLYSPPRAPATTLINIPAFKLWLGLQGNVSTATGEEKFTEQIRAATLSPLSRVCRLDRETYARVLAAPRDAHLMLQIRNTVALSIVRDQLARDPNLQKQANEVTKILDAEHGNIGVTPEHKCPHPRLLMDTYSSLNGGWHVPIDGERLAEFFERTQVADDQVMNYLGIFGNIEENANTLLYSQDEFANGVVYGRSPHLNRSVVDPSGLIAGRSVVRTFDHAHKPFEGDIQSRYLSPDQRQSAANDLGLVLAGIRNRTTGLQADHLKTLQENILQPDRRQAEARPLSNDPTAADADHVDLVTSLIAYFTERDPNLPIALEATWQNTVAAYHQVVTPVLLNGLIRLREAEESAGLHKTYQRHVPDAAQFLKEEGEAIEKALSDAATISPHQALNRA